MLHFYTINYKVHSKLTCLFPVDWAALAKQWIAQKDAITTIQGDQAPPPPAPMPPPTHNQEPVPADSMDLCNNENSEQNQSNGGEESLVLPFK